MGRLGKKDNVHACKTLAGLIDGNYVIDQILYPPLENSTIRITITRINQILCTYCKLHTIPQEDWYKVLHQKLLSNLLNHR